MDKDKYDHLWNWVSDFGRNTSVKEFFFEHVTACGTRKPFSFPIISYFLESYFWSQAIPWLIDTQCRIMEEVWNLELGSYRLRLSFYHFHLGAWDILFSGLWGLTSVKLK